MLAELLPREVAAAEAFGEIPGATLLPGEEAVLARAVDKRRREFTTARACARAALARLGMPPVAILPGARGAPQWPAGIVGSMTHCDGYRAAAVARVTDVLAIGIDAEPDDKLPDGVLDAIARADERTGLSALATVAGPPCWDRLLFSAKESVYKAWFSLTGRSLGFEDAAITINPVTGTFSARLLVPGYELPAGELTGGRELTGFTGRWLAGNGLVLTAIVLARRGRRADLKS